jgi:hypothetical protein
MAIEVVRRGKAPEDVVYKADCYTCKSVLKFKREDGKITYDQRDGDFLTIECPVCEKHVSVDLHSKNVE